MVNIESEEIFPWQFDEVKKVKADQSQPNVPYELEIPEDKEKLFGLMLLRINQMARDIRNINDELQELNAKVSGNKKDLEELDLPELKSCMFNVKDAMYSFIKGVSK